MRTSRAPTSGCARLEEAISARIDGEDPGVADEVVDAHLQRCERCRAFQAEATAQHRRWRVRSAGAVPDLSGRIVAAVPAGAPPRPRLTVGDRAFGAKALGAATLAVVAVLVAGFAIGSRLAGGSPGGGSALVSAVAHLDRSNPAYPGATILPASQAVPKPDIVMTDTAGRPYDIATATAHHVTVLYFGYTHCPDLCPYNMALTAEAIHGLPPAMRKDVTVVFVTTDPARDTPPVIRAWLDRFTSQFPGDPPFVGLTAPPGRIQLAERQIHMLLSYAAKVDTATGSYAVVHATYQQIYPTQGTSTMQVNYTEPPAEYTRTLEDLIRRDGRGA